MEPGKFDDGDINEGELAYSNRLASPPSAWGEIPVKTMVTAMTVLRVGDGFAIPATYKRMKTWMEFSDLQKQKKFDILGEFE